MKEELIDEKFNGKKYTFNGYFSYEFRHYIYEQCNNKCWYCDLPLPLMNYKNPPQIDHIEARSTGGTDDEWNLVLACRRCNCSKGNRNFFAYIKNPTMCNSENVYNDEGLIISFSF